MDRSAVNRLLVVALDTFGDDNPLVFFPIRMGVNVGVTVGTFYVVLHMYAVVMFGVLLFVATLAVNFADLDFTFHMLGKVRNLHVTTGTGVFAMD